LDKSGHGITNLPQSAFTVWENGASQQIKTFKQEDVPVSMGLLVDNSVNMREQLLTEESAALAVVRDSGLQDEIFVVNFNQEAYIDADFTNDIKVMEQGFTKMESRGGSHMRDAIRMSIDHLQNKAKRDKKVILVVTGRNDDASVTSIDALTRLVQQDDVLIYAIRLVTGGEKRKATKAGVAFDLLVESTGGQVLYPRNLSEVESTAHEVGRDIRNQYTIAYTPANNALDGGFRQIKVVIEAPGNPVARTRNGYYATNDRP
jgi:Ca-activated chloride channel family protein